MSPNRNYLKGRRLEYKRKQFYESLTCHVLRSSGSHGKFDLTVIMPGAPSPSSNSRLPRPRPKPKGCARPSSPTHRFRRASMPRC